MGINMWKIESKAYWMQDGKMQTGEAEAFFPFFDGKRHIISLVGGGGKSTLLEYLASCFAARGMRTAIMTTTRMACPAHICRSIDDCRACWVQGEYASGGERTENGKFRQPEDALLEQLLREAEAIIVEADGAHMRACKAPAAHEPVILPQSDIVIGVMGVEVLGGEISDVCHRPEHVCALLGCAGDHQLTASDMARILLSPKGTRKDVGDREFYIVLNKCDDEQRVKHGMQILGELRRRGHEQVVLNRFEEKGL